MSSAIYEVYGSTKHLHYLTWHVSPDLVAANYLMVSPYATPLASALSHSVAR